MVVKPTSFGRVVAGAARAEAGVGYGIDLHGVVGLARRDTGWSKGGLRLRAHQDTGSDEEVALAIGWHDAIVRHSRAAAKMLARVQHPNIALTCTPDRFTMPNERS